MMSRWSLIARLGAIIAIALFALQLVLVAGIYLERTRDTGGSFRHPLPDQTAAMVELFESSADRQSLLRALNSADLSVTLEPAGFDAYVAEPVRLPEVESLLDRYVLGLGGRRVAAFIALPPGGTAQVRQRDRSLWTDHPLRMAIELKTGEVLVVESRGGDLPNKLFSRPLGFFSGLFAVIVAVIVLWAVRRETRPLRALADAARRFSQDGAVQPVRESGAPELRGLIQAFNGMQERIGELLTARSLMLGALGHDLRTYITRLHLRLDTVEETRLREAACADLNRMAGLVDDSLTLARLGMDGAGDEATDLDPLLRTLCDELGPDVQLLSPPVGPITVRGSETTLRRLFSNLIENAVKYGLRCRVCAECTQGWATVTIIDDGPGLPVSELDKVVRPFYRSEKARTLDGKGQGLGLAIAHEIAVVSGGALTLDSPEGSGLICRVRLPLV